MTPSIEINIKPEHFNEIYLGFLAKYKNEKYIRERARFQIFYGGSGGGKSEFIGRMLFLDCLREPGHNILIVMKQEKKIKGAAYALMRKIRNEYLRDIPNPDEICRVTESPMVFKFYNGCEIRFSGVDDSEQLKSITFENGPLSTTWVEECTAFTLDDFKELNRRLRGTTAIGLDGENLPFRMVLSFNPIDKNNWVYTFFFEDLQLKTNYRLGGINNRYEYYDRVDKESGIKVGVAILKTTCEDNKFVDEVYKAELRNEEDPYLKDIYYYGNFGVISDENAIVKYNRALTCCDHEIELGMDEEVGLGIDVSGDGDDLSIIKARIGPVEIKLDEDDEMVNTESTTELARVAAMIARRLQRQEQVRTGITPIVRINVDKTGIGKGTKDTLDDMVEMGTLQNVIVIGIDFGSSAPDKDQYFNLVTQMYFNIRDLTNQKKIVLIRNEKTLTEVCTRRYYIDQGSSTKFRIESKQEYRKRNGGKSPDYADALVLCFWVPPGHSTFYQGTGSVDELYGRRGRSYERYSGGNMRKKVKERARRAA
jgi:PBSX family phage terminase large subunit